MRHAHAEDPRLHQRVRESVRQVPLPINRFGGLPNVRFQGTYSRQNLFSCG